MVKIKETAGTKTYSCELCGESFFSFGLTEKHEKWECSQDPEETVTDDIEEEATDEEDDYGDMRAELHTGEKVILAKHNRPGWGSKTVAWWGPLAVGFGDIFVGVMSGGATVPTREGDWHPGSFYLTNQRIIFEGTNKAINQIVDLKDIDSCFFKDIKGKERKVIGEGETHLFVSEEDESEHKFAFGIPEEVQEVQKQLVSFNQEVIIQKAKHCEEVLDYKKAIKLWEKIGKHEEAKRIRAMVIKGQSQTIVHGDYVDDRDTTYVDDRDTIVKDSVVSKSSIGGGSSKMQELKELTEMKEKGLINDKDYEKMKREIIG